MFKHTDCDILEALYNITFGPKVISKNDFWVVFLVSFITYQFFEACTGISAMCSLTEQWHNKLNNNKFNAKQKQINKQTDFVTLKTQHSTLFYTVI